MPELTASGRIFTLGAEGEFDGIFLSSGRGRFQAGVSVDAELELCHGASAAVGIQAMAELQAALTVFMPSVRGDGRAQARAGLKARLQLSPNLFGRVGFTADLSAHAEAAVAGRISVGADFDQVSGLASTLLDGLAYDIFIAFLNEVVIEAGVWGKASFAAMAAAHIEVNGTLRSDDEAGFHIAAGFDVGLGGGTGWDFFAGVGLTDPRRFYNTATDLITQEIVQAARKNLPVEVKPAAEFLELLLPITLGAAYDLGQMTALEALGPNEDAARPFNKAFGDRLLMFLMDKLAEAGDVLMSRLIDEAMTAILGGQLDAAERVRLRTLVEALVDDLEDEKPSLELVGRTIGPLMEIAGIVAPSEVARWKRPLAIVWTAVAAGDALRNTVASASASASFVGLGTASASGDHLALPTPPAVVLDDYAAFFGATPSSIEFSDAVDYLVGLGLMPMLNELLPQLGVLLQRISDKFDLTPGDFVTAVIQGAAGEDATETELYQKLRDFAKEGIDSFIMTDLIPTLKTSLPSNADAAIYVREVAEPCLLASSGFVFDNVDRLVQGDTAFVDSFQSGLSTLAFKVMSRNMVVLSDILLDLAMDELYGGFEAIEQSVQADSGHAWVSGGSELIRSSLPFVDTGVDSYLEAVQILMSDLARAGKHSAGPNVWTDQRRARMRQLLVRLLVGADAGLDYADRAQVDTFFHELAQCWFISDEDGVVELVALLNEVTWDELEIVFREILPALSAFFLRITLASVDLMEEKAKELIEAIADALRLAWEEFQYWRTQAILAVEEFQRISRFLGDEAERAAVILRSAAMRDAILDRLLSDGLDAVERKARGALGFGLLPTDQQNDAVRLARSIFDELYRLTLRPVIDQALRGLGGMADNLGDVLHLAADVPDLIERLAEAVKDEVLDALGLQNVPFPAELSIDHVAEVAGDVVSSGASVVRSILVAALGLVGDHQAAEQIKNQAETNERTKRLAWETQRDSHDSMLGDDLHLQILSPGAINPSADKNWVYAPEIPVSISIRGARPTFVQAGATTRIYLALNGQQLQVHPSAWRYDPSRKILSLRHTLTVANAPLVANLNVLECSVVDGGEQKVRQAVAFAVDLSLEPRDAKVIIAGDLSHFDTSGDDHRHTRDEFVALRNTGDRAINLEGWRILDRVRHTFVFPDVELLPASTLKLRTGIGSDTDTDVFWGRRAAIWNNRGDSAYLVDNDQVLQSEYVY